jgi:hemolysin activation/secretion protein
MKKAVLIYFFNIFLCGSVFGLQIPPGQGAGSKIKDYLYQEKQDEAIKRIREQRSPLLDESEIKTLPYKKTAVYINEIIIQQDVFGEENIIEEIGQLNVIIEQYKNKALTLKDMKGLAAFLTEHLADKGVRAYIPRQNFQNGYMYINLRPEERF